MPISAQKMALASTKLQYPGKVPVFYLPSASEAGGQSGPAAMRSKYNLVLAFVEGTREGEAYLQSLALVTRDILDRAARPIAVMSSSPDDVRAIAARLTLPFTLLADEGAITTHRLMGEEVSRLCV